MRTFVWLVILLISSGGVSYWQQPFPTLGENQWDTLLRRFVNAQHRVNYGRLKKEGSAQLTAFVEGLGKAQNQPLAPNPEKALLINAYNAFTVQWILDNYPVQSIWSTSAPFTQARHRLRGKTVSLDQIESQLRAMADPRIHAALVYAARSCPPLRQEAYAGARVDEQLDDNVRQWLADRSLNTFDPEHGQAEISPIFEWYRKDFDSYPGGLEGFLRKYAPPGIGEALASSKLKLNFKDYNWGLNDESALGSKYSRLHFALDKAWNWFIERRWK
jgi:Protein of unknown function, DUF547